MEANDQKKFSKAIKLHMQMHHLHARHEAHSPIYNKWLDIKAPYTGPTMESKDVTMHVLAHSSCKDPNYLLLLLIWASLYNIEYYEVLKIVVTSPMSLENVVYVHGPLAPRNL